MYRYWLSSDIAESIGVAVAFASTAASLFAKVTLPCASIRYDEIVPLAVLEMKA